MILKIIQFPQLLYKLYLIPNICVLSTNTSKQIENLHPFSPEG